MNLVDPLLLAREKLEAVAHPRFAAISPMFIPVAIVGRLAS